MTRKILTAVTAAALTVGASHAFASATTSATLSDISITLIDLDPTDGVAPSITFTDARGSSLRTSASTTLPASSSNDAQSGDGVFGAAASGSTLLHAGSGATLSGNAFAGTGGAATSAFAQPAGSSQGLGMAFFGNLFGNNRFTLSANTELTMTAHAELWASAPDAATGDYATSTVRFSLASTDDGSPPQDSDAFLDATAGGFWNPTSDTFSGDLSVSFSNASAFSTDGMFYGFVQSLADSQSPAAAVPEPESALLMLAGLGALAAARRRRAR